MKQTNYYSNLSLGDSQSTDSMGRLRTSNPIDIFSAQFTYDTEPVVFESITTGVGSAVTHNATNRVVEMSLVASPNGSSAYLQSFQHLSIQPGRSQEIFIAFNFGPISLNTVKFAGYGDGVNGVDFRSTSGFLSFQITSQASPDINIPQSQWNLDKFDGEGASGITLDQTKMQVLVIDFQAFYAGRLRIGFYFEGIIYYAHEATTGNYTDLPGITSLSMPVRAGITSAATGATSGSMILISCAASVEAGSSDPYYYSLTASRATAVTVPNGTPAHGLTIRPKLLFKGFTNRTLFKIGSVDIVNTGASSLRWQLVIGQALNAPSFTDVNTNVSAYEFDTVGTLNGSPFVVVATGYIGSTAQNKGSISESIRSIYPITLNAAGANRTNGQISVILTGIGGATTAFVDVNYAEAR